LRAALPLESGCQAQARRRIRLPAATSKQLQPRRQRQAAGERLHALLQKRFELAPRVRVRRDDQVLDDVFLVGLEQRLVDLRAAPRSFSSRSAN